MDLICFRSGSAGPWSVAMFKRLFGSNKTHSVSNELDLERLPVHIALIMDGNGRWAKARNLPRLAGHQRGVEALKTIIRYCSDIGIRYLTVYAFSTENWNRPKDEVDGLMEILVRFLRAEIDELHENQVCMKVLGDITRIPTAGRNEIVNALERTAENKGLTFSIALNYGSRDEILRGVRKIAEDVKAGILEPDDITEQVFCDSLYTAGIPDPDLLIRTSGELRISNYLLWQIAYSELWFTETAWPDFSPVELDKALIAYQDRDRRYGKI